MGERHRSDVTDVRSWVRAAVFVLAVLFPRLLTAQVIGGRVLEAGSNAALPTTEVRLLAADGTLLIRTLADSTGAFRMMAPAPGRYMLEGVLLGYSTARGALLEVARNRELVVELRLSRTALPLEAVRVIADRTMGGGRLAGYYRRADLAKRTGFGRVTTREEIERLRYGNVRNFAPNVHTARNEDVSEPRPGCIATTFLDNVHVPLREINAVLSWDDLEGVEFYQGNDVPVEYRNMSGPCAIVLYWTRSDVRIGQPLNMKRIAVAGAVILGIILIVR